MSELKPCPFCDGEIETKDFDFIASHLYRCKKCKSGFILQPVTGFSAEDVWNMKNTKYFPSEVQQALDRMKPKKAIYSEKDAVMVCPDCGSCVATVGWRKDVCDCGQKIEWSE